MWRHLSVSRSWVLKNTYSCRIVVILVSRTMQEYLDHKCLFSFIYLTIIRPQTCPLRGKCKMFQVPSHTPACLSLIWFFVARSPQCLQWVGWGVGGWLQSPSRILFHVLVCECLLSLFSLVSVSSFTHHTQLEILEMSWWLFFFSGISHTTGREATGVRRIFTPAGYCLLSEIYCSSVLQCEMRLLFLKCYVFSSKMRR